MKGHLKMSEKERNRLGVFRRLDEDQLRIVEAAKQLRISYRQCKRSYRRYKEEGDAGLIHRSRGRISNRAKPVEFRKQVISFYRERYYDFGATLAAEKLCEEGLVLDHETLRRWLVAEGLWTKRHKRRTHRSWRERKGHFGELVQLDGSHHRWFGSDREPACLVNMVDDATGHTEALIAEQETTKAAMMALWQWIESHGVPKSLYTDKKNVYVTNRKPGIEEQLAGKKPLTAFGKACEKLSIDIIMANSPQAKGRVERNNGVYQDRFLKEMRLRGITTIEGANELLSEWFCNHLNAKFAKDPQEKEDFHMPWPKDMDPSNVFCFEHNRILTNDWTIRFEGKMLQVLKDNRPLPRSGEKILVRVHLDGQMDLVYKDVSLKYKEIAIGPAAVMLKNTSVDLPGKGNEHRSHTVVIAGEDNRAKRKPSRNHPWRKDYRLILSR